MEVDLQQKTRKIMVTKSGEKLLYEDLTYSRHRGFTLVELLIVIGIISILTGMVLINFRPGQQQLTLQRAASKLAQDIRRTQEMAMSARECTDPTPCPAGGVPSGGYGIYFDQDVAGNYIIYADGGATQNLRRDSVEDLETVFLEQGVSIISVTPTQITRQLSINFKPPDPKTSFKDGAGNIQTYAQIILQADSKTKTIMVNQVGQIEID